MERIKIKRLYVGKFTLTSLAFGIFVGLFNTLILVALSLGGLGQTQSFSALSDFLQPSFIIYFGVGMTLILAIFFAIAGFLFALFYNLVSKMGLNMDLGMSPVEEDYSKQTVAQPAPTIQPAPTSQLPTQNSQRQFY